MAIATSICRSTFTICSGACFFPRAILGSFHTSFSHYRWYRFRRAAQVASEYKIIISISGLEVPADRKTIQIDIAKGSLRDILNELAMQAPGYEWRQADDGTIRVITGGSELALVNVPIRLKIKKQEVFSVERIVRSRPEIKEWLQQHGCSLERHYTQVTGQFDNTKYSFDIKGKPLGNVLDEIANVNHTYLWSVTQSSSQPCTINLNF